jgi:hypothetical protein
MNIPIMLNVKVVINILVIIGYFDLVYVVSKTDSIDKESKFSFQLRMYNIFTFFLLEILSLSCREQQQKYFWNSKFALRNDNLS